MNPNSREEYEKTLAYAKEHNYIAMYNAMVEDGYDPSIDWQSLRKEEEEERQPRRGSGDAPEHV